MDCLLEEQRLKYELLNLSFEFLKSYKLYYKYKLYQLLHI